MSSRTLWLWSSLAALGAVSGCKQRAEGSQTLNNGAEVDVYCNDLTTPADSFARPYTGSYGKGLSGLPAWEAENLLQTQKLAAYVQKQSGNRPAVVMGEFYAGPGYKDPVSKKQVLQAVETPSFNALLGSFAQSLPDGVTPVCTLCYDNPIISMGVMGQSTWTSNILMSHIPVPDVASETTFFTDPVVPVMMGTTKLKVPLSKYYGVRSVISFSP